MTDPRQDRLADLILRVRGGVSWLARFATGMAVVGGLAGALLWAVITGGSGGLGAIVLIVVLLAPAAWLLNVRFAFRALLGLPAKLGTVGERLRSDRSGDAGRDERPTGSMVVVARSVHGAVREYDDLLGSWAAVAQMVSPWFWFLTVLACLAVPVLVVVSLIAALIAAVV